MNSIQLSLAAFLVYTTMFAADPFHPSEQRAARLVQDPRDAESRKLRDMIRTCEDLMRKLDRENPIVGKQAPRLREKLDWLYDEYNAVDSRDYRKPNMPFDKALQWIAEYDLKRALELLVQKKNPEQVRRGKQPTGALLRITRREQFLASWDLHIPRNYDPSTAHPLVICFQTGLNTEAFGAAGYFVCQSFQSGPPRSSVHLGHLLAAMIRETSADFNIDPNRVYLTGFSTGGATAFVYAYRYPDLVAGVAPVCPAAEWRDGGARHIQNVAVCVLYGKQDGWTRKGAQPIIERLKASNHPRWEAFGYDAGHTPTPALVSDPSRVLAFFAKHRRDPNPRKVWKWVEHKRWCSAYWLMVKLRQDGKVQGGVIGEIQPGNTVALQTTEHVAAVALYLNQHLVDLEKPVKVVANGKPLYSGPVKPELYVEILNDHQPYWQDAVITGLNPYWRHARKWPAPGQPLPPPRWLTTDAKGNK